MIKCSCGAPAIAYIVIVTKTKTTSDPVCFKCGQSKQLSAPIGAHVTVEEIQ